MIKTKMSQLSFRLMAFCALLLFANSCKRNTVYTDSYSFFNDAVTIATITGQVIDEDGTPLKDAVVKVGMNSYTTGQDGIFYFNKISTPLYATLITVTKSNYLTGYRTLRLQLNKDGFARIMLIEMKNASTFNSITGGVVNVNGGGSVTFPSNAIVYKSNGTPYNGIVTMYSKWLDPTDQDISLLMPGDLRGLDGNNNEKLLQTFGMMGVELLDNSGQSLQLAPNKSASLSFPIPASISQYAPNVIPLWFFDASTGLWKQEGSASKQGSNYVGDVKHFSFWNCDVPNNFVNLDLTLNDNLGSPLANMQVKITNPATGAVAYGYTNGAGYVSGMVPDNATLTLEVMMYPCGTSIYSQTVTTFSSAISLGTIVVTVPSINNATVSGTVLDCLGAPVSNGYVSISTGTNTVLVPTNAAGGFVASVVLCALPAAATVAAYNMSSAENGSSTASLVAGSNNLGNLTACGTLNQFINWTSTVGSTPTSFSIIEPVGNFFFSYYSISPTTTIYGNDSTITTNEYINFSFSGLDNSSGAHDILNFNDHLSSNDVPVSTIPVTLTNYSATPGGFVEGSFTGNVTGVIIPLRTITCNFRVKRN